MSALNALFDENVYLARNPDVAAAVQAKRISSGFQHFLTSGIREGRTRFSRFYDRASTEFEYRQAYPDVDAAIRRGNLVSGLQHYVQPGEAEGRTLFPQGFDEQWYQRRYPDVVNAITQKFFSSGLEHYVRFGRGEERSVSALFEFDYFNLYPDVKNARDSGGIYLSAADHFLHAGKFEGRAATFAGTKGNDLVIGNAAIDTLTGVELDVGVCVVGGTVTGGQCKEYDSFGINEIDTLVGGPGIDTFELGRSVTGRAGVINQMFYASFSQVQDQDFARIQNFEVGKDRLILGAKSGEPSTFSLGSRFISQSDGVYVYAVQPETVGSPLRFTDLVAIVEGVANASDVLGTTTFLG
ncbi:MAG: hypothetical protein EA001_04465 [Oscillatoriales cyanobacterium]|nr:MAG: hypothetical protein EA001_04465 [Oscillatoriales cyanobacterium]